MEPYACHLSIVATLKDWASVAQALVTILALFAAGIFAVVKFQIFRDTQPHLSISQEVSHRLLGGEYVHLAVTATLSNRSKVKVELLDCFFRLQQISPLSDDDVETLYAQVFIDREIDALQWPTLDKHTRRWRSGQLTIEPGEIQQITCEFIVSSAVDSILAYSYFYNPEGVSSARASDGWDATTVHDLRQID